MDDRDEMVGETLRAGFEDRLPVDDLSRRRARDAAMAAFDRAIEASPVPHGEVEIELVGGAPGAARHRLAPRMLMAAAAVMFVIVGATVVVVRGDGDRVQTRPAEPHRVEDPVPDPTPTVLPPIPTDWDSWSEQTDPGQTVLCVARTLVRGARTAAPEPPNPVGADPESEWALVQMRSLVRLSEELIAAGVASELAGAVEEEVQRLEAAEAAQYADEGLPDPTFAGLVVDLVDGTATNALWEPDAERCWLDRPDVSSEIDALIADLGPTPALLCLSGELLDAALVWQADDVEADRSAALGRAAVVAASYLDAEDSELTEVLDEVGRLSPSPDLADLVAAARARLADLEVGLGHGSCAPTS